jgi:hypothetical protein
MRIAKKRKTKRPSRASSYSRSKSRVHNDGTCFVIMPFGSWFDQYYEEIYIPAIESAGLIARRADDLYRPSTIVNDIWSLTKDAKVILADLSGKNPNVFYELGLAHAIAKPAVLVSEAIEDIPFDLRGLRVIIYDKNASNWGGVLRSTIKSSITEVLASPLDSVLPTFLKIKESSSEKSVSRTDKELISLKQDLELVKQELQVRNSTLPTSRETISTISAMELARSNRERGRNDEVTISELLQQGFTHASARRVINRLNQEYMKQIGDARLAKKNRQ